MARLRKAKHSRKRRLIMAILLLLTAMICFCAAAGWFGLRESTIKEWFGIREFSHKGDGFPLTVHFIDVGDGDSILIVSGTKTVLIDTGPRSLHGTVKNYLQHYGVTQLDVLIVTHPDSDHIGDFPSVAGSIPIRQVFFSSLDYGEKGQAFSEQLREYDLTVIDPQTNAYQLGEAMLTFCSPVKAYSDPNDQSLVVRLTYGEISFLLTGDCGKKAEQEMLSRGEELHSTVLKVGHHGSKSSTTQEFLDAAAPAYAVLTVSGTHAYLPNSTVVDRLEASGAEILRTDRDGCILMGTDGKDLSVWCEKTA